MLLSMGGTFLAFLRNINHLHYNLQQDFRESTFPFFKVEELENGTSKESSFYFSYSSSRAGLAPFAKEYSVHLASCFLMRLSRW